MDSRPPPRRQPPRTEQLQSIDEVELRAFAVASQHVDLVAKHGVLENQLPAGPDRIHGDTGDLVVCQKSIAGSCSAPIVELEESAQPFPALDPRVREL